MHFKASKLLGQRISVGGGVVVVVV
jgi:hypothetical protein